MPTRLHRQTIIAPTLPCKAVYSPANHAAKSGFNVRASSHVPGKNHVQALEVIVSRILCGLGGILFFNEFVLPGPYSSVNLISPDTILAYSSMNLVSSCTIFLRICSTRTVFYSILPDSFARILNSTNFVNPDTILDQICSLFFNELAPPVNYSSTNLVISVTIFSKFVT